MYDALPLCIKKEVCILTHLLLRFRNIPKSGEQISYRTKLMNAEFVKYLANSKSVAAFFANDGSLAMAFFRLTVTMEILLDLAPSTAIR